MSEIKYPRSWIFTKDQDDEIIGLECGTKIEDLARAWNMTPEQVRGRRSTLMEYFRRIDRPLSKLSTANRNPNKRTKVEKRRNPEPVAPSPRPSRFARPDFFNENLRQMTKGAV